MQHPTYDDINQLITGTILPKYHIGIEDLKVMEDIKHHLFITPC